MDKLFSTLSLNRSTILIFLIFGFLFGFFYRWVAKKIFTKSVRGSSKNIDNSGRRMRALTGFALLIRAIMTSMSPRLLFFAGFCFFEALFSRCGFYAAIGKSSCPLE